MTQQDYKREALIRRMAVTDADRTALEAEGQFSDWPDPDGNVNTYNWVAYLPSCNRAVWITNGDPVWFDTTSLEDAVEQVRSGAELSN